MTINEYAVVSTGYIHAEWDRVQGEADQGVQHGVQYLLRCHLLYADGGPTVDGAGVCYNSEGGRLAAGIEDPVVLGEQMWLFTQLQNFLFIQYLECTFIYHFVNLGFQVT